MRLVLVTGAGATRDLRDGAPLPLMPDWCDRLCAALDDREAGLAKSFELSPGLSSEDFEEALGYVIRWQEMRWLNERFAGVGGVQPGQRFGGEVHTARENETRRLDVFQKVLNETLYHEFGTVRIDDAAAESAYRGLLDHTPGLESVVAVTTNYDPSIEIALVRLGREPDTGFERNPGRTPRLAPEGMVNWEDKHGGTTPVIHLHGAVGWYRREGDVVVEQAADQPYTPALGVPVVLYPDPEKDPTSDAVVEALWREFESGLDGATHALVLGHSLHDPALVDRLRRLASSTSLGVSARVDADYFQGTGYHRVRQRSRIRDLLPNAVVIPCLFGKSPQFDAEALERWIRGEPEPAWIETSGIPPSK